MYAAASTGVAAQHQGIGSGIASTGQQLGNGVGLAVLVAIANQSATQDLRIAVLVSAAGVIVTAAIALTGPRRAPVFALSN
jgi:hypothetical protein